MSLLLQAFMENEPGIRRYLRKFSLDVGDTEDLAQETFLRAFAADAGQTVISYKAFLYRIARNLALNERAKHASIYTDRIEDIGGQAAFVEMRYVSAEGSLDSRQKMAAFAEAVEQLPSQCRRVFILRKVHGLSQADVATELGISASTVEKHVAAGLVKCARYMRQRGHDVGHDDGGGPSAAVAPIGRRRGPRRVADDV